MQIISVGMAKMHMGALLIAAHFLKCEELIIGCEKHGNHQGSHMHSSHNYTSDIHDLHSFSFLGTFAST